MIIKADKNERDTIEKCCAELGFTSEFFTIENNSSMLQVIILWDGAELAPEYAWSLGRIIAGEKIIKSVL